MIIRVMLLFFISLFMMSCSSAGGSLPRPGQILPDNFGFQDTSTGVFIGKRCPVDQVTGIKHCEIKYKTKSIFYDIMPDGTETERIEKLNAPDSKCRVCHQVEWIQVERIQLE